MVEEGEGNVYVFVASGLEEGAIEHEQPGNTDWRLFKDERRA